MDGSLGGFVPSAHNTPALLESIFKAPLFIQVVAFDNCSVAVNCSEVTLEDIIDTEGPEYGDGSK